MPKKAIVIASGGLDSTVLTYHLKSKGFDVHMISFNYGQKHLKELQYAARTASKLGLRHNIIDLSSLNKLLGHSALTDPFTEVPNGHYAAANMSITIVPNRNMMMLSIATSIAIAEQAQCIAIGVHAGDHFIYPDTRPVFIESFQQTITIANEGFGDLDLYVYAPYLHTVKAGIVAEGEILGVPFEDCWSCYKGGNLHCSKCGTCVERKEAFEIANVKDKIVYENYYNSETLHS